MAPSIRCEAKRRVRQTMEIRFDDQTVAVSGAGHGFGRCIAETFAGLGAQVFGCDLSADELAETAKAGVTTEVVDLTDRAAAAYGSRASRRSVAARSMCSSTTRAASP